MYKDLKYLNLLSIIFNILNKNLINSLMRLHYMTYIINFFLENYNVYNK